MATFMYLYRGPATPASDLTPEQGAARMSAFAAWMAKLGPALVDAGSPFGLSAAVRDDGARARSGDLIGYSIVEAEDLTSAMALTDGLPFLADGEGTRAVEVFELVGL